MGHHLISDLLLWKMETKLSHHAPLPCACPHPHPHPVSELPWAVVPQTLEKGRVLRRKRPQMSSGSGKPRKRRTPRVHWSSGKLVRSEGRAASRGRWQPQILDCRMEKQ